MNFVCPKCYEKLNIQPDGRAVCPKGHSFDKSRFGYYNLFLTSVGGTHGDNREMVDARRTFLDTGAYFPLADRVAELAAEAFPRGGVMLDVGLGEGYYTSVISDRLKGSVGELSILGFDISKDAARYAKKRCPDVEVAVASAYKMPLSDSSVDLVTNVFSPLALEETVRVLRSGGRFIMAVPDVYHLWELKSLLYKTPYKNELSDTELKGLRLVFESRVSTVLDLDMQEKVKSLFMMTPYAYRTPTEARERLFKTESLKVRAEFVVFVYEKP